MKTMTVRGLEPDLVDRLKAAARDQGKSVNFLVVDILKKHVGLEKEKQFTAVHCDMDHLFGRWSKAEFKAIQDKIDAESQIDAELWQ